MGRSGPWSVRKGVGERDDEMECMEILSDKPSMAVSDVRRVDQARVDEGRVKVEGDCQGDLALYKDINPDVVFVKIPSLFPDIVCMLDPLG